MSPLQINHLLSPFLITPTQIDLAGNHIPRVTYGSPAFQYIISDTKHKWQPCTIIAWCATCHCFMIKSIDMDTQLLCYEVVPYHHLWIQSDPSPQASYFPKFSSDDHHCRPPGGHTREDCRTCQDSWKAQWIKNGLGFSI